MEHDKIKATLNEVNSLDNSQKQSYKNMSYLIAEDINRKKGKAHKTIIQIGHNKENIIHLTSTNKNHKTKYPTAHDKLNSLKLNAKVSKELENDINDGIINSTHITDILKISIGEELAKLNNDDQQKVINKIINNRNERNLINSEVVATQSLLNNEDNNTQIIEIWYRGVIRSLEQFILQLEAGLKIYEHLPIQQQNYLLNNFVKIQELLQKYMNELDLVDK